MAARAKRRSRSTRGRSRRWLLLGAGVLIGTGAAWLLVRGTSQRPWSEIDAGSRAQLERVLEQADREEALR